MEDVAFAPHIRTLRDDATAWIDVSLSAHGLLRTSALTLFRDRPWAIVMQVETSAGLAWFKAAAPATAFEARLYPLLTRVAPDIVLSPLAIDEERGWMLLPHGGETLDHGVDADVLVDRLVAVVSRYAQMQRSLATFVPEMLGRGVPDMRSSMLPGRFDEVIAYSREFVSRGGSGEHQALLERVERLRDSVAEWAAMAEQTAGGASLDHSDLHARNILLPAGKDGAVTRVYDWGDSIVAHPFTSLLVLLRDLMTTLRSPLNDRRVQRVMDAYLEPYGDLAPRSALADAAMVACQVGKITRAHAWVRAVSTFVGDVDEDDASAPLEWLGELLSPNLLGLD